MPTHDPILPHPQRIRRRDAADIADEVIADIERRGRVALFIDPDGQVVRTAVRGTQWNYRVKRYPCSLAGVYDAGASRSAIISDIEAMERGA